MLLGEYKHTIDAKNRMFLPSRFREEFGEKVYISKSLDGLCVSVYSQESWEVFMKKIESLPWMDSRDVRRVILSSSVETPIDSQGRILIPQTLIDSAHLEKNVRVIGIGDSAEIWNEERLDNKIDAITPDDLKSKLIELGF